MSCNGTCAYSVTSVNATKVTIDLVVQILKQFSDSSKFFITGPLMVLALPMTIITVLVFCRTPLGTTKTTRIYYTTIAVCNVISTVVRDAIIEFAYYGVNFITMYTNRWDAEGMSLWSCRILDFILFSFEVITNNTYVALALERCIVLYLPLQSASLVGQRKAAAGVVFIVLTGFLACACTLAGASAYSETARCSINFTASGVLSRLALLMVFLCWITPTAVTILLNTLILLKMTQSSSKALTVESQGGRKKAKQTEASVTLVIVTGIHVLVYIPMGFFRMMPLLMSLNSSVPSVWTSMATYGYVWLCVTHVSNYVVYYRRVKGFKENVHNLLHCLPPIRTADELANK